MNWIRCPSSSELASSPSAVSSKQVSKHQKPVSLILQLLHGLHTANKQNTFSIGLVGVSCCNLMKTAVANLKVMRGGGLSTDDQPEEYGGSS